jgi:urease accessory protein
MIPAWRSGVLAGALLLPASALAHSPIKGINSFYNGLLHPVLVPAQLLFLLALGLLLGRQEPQRIQASILAFLAATVAGLAAAGFDISIDAETALLVGAASAGLLVAADPRLPGLGCLVISVVSGLLIGLDSPQQELAGKERFAALFGSGIGIYLLVLYAVALADAFRKRHWQRVGVRVIGSWLAASALLVLALSLAPDRR